MEARVSISMDDVKNGKKEKKVKIATHIYTIYYIIARIEKRGSACRLGRRKLSCLAAPRPGPTCRELGFLPTTPHKARRRPQW